MEKSRFFSVFQAFFMKETPYFHSKIQVLQFKFQVFALKFQYGLFLLHYFQPMF